MKQLNVIIFANENKYDKFSNRVCEALSDLPESKGFCGAWGEIRDNDQEVISAISSTVNYFIASEKAEIFFGCCAKDYKNIIAEINTQNCEVEKLSYRDV
ncbi:MAG: hypothetical protein J1E39_07275 [Eubacterium sp.]|nr:hypothetical protein [Eubacterium sp.]